MVFLNNEYTFYYRKGQEIERIKTKKNGLNMFTVKILKKFLDSVLLFHVDRSLKEVIIVFLLSIY